MIWTFIGALMAAVLAACVSFVVSRWVGRDVRWLIPASAGAAMLGFTMWNDYTWFSRTAGALPDSFVVTSRVESSQAIQPWTLVAPMVSRFAAVDPTTARRHPAHPAMAMVDLFLLERYAPTRVSTQMVDCAAGRRADVPATADFDDDGLPVGLAWLALGEGDPLIAAVCGAMG